VYAAIRQTTTRNATAVADLTRYGTDHRVDVHAVELDVTSQDSADVAVDRTLAERGRLDVVAHNAGHMILGAAEAFTPEQFADLYDVNVLGTQRVSRAALPKLREQGSGLLIRIGSSSTRGGCLPFLAPYFAAKAAMDALAVSSAAEVLPFGIDTASSCPARSPPAPTTSPTQAPPPTPTMREVAEAVARLVVMEQGTRPLGTHIDPSRDGSEVVSAVADRVRADFFRRIGLDSLLTAGSSL
jgi:NAD(P)-dependent dehydrogenase (short-subunit alcohol dehydrogenase family)